MALELDKSLRDALARALADHMRDELQLELERMDAVLLLDFLSDTLGPHYYNQGVRDAQVLLQSRIESLSDDLGALEKPTRR